MNENNEPPPRAEDEEEKRCAIEADDDLESSSLIEISYDKVVTSPQQQAEEEEELDTDHVILDTALPPHLTTRLEEELALKGQGQAIIEKVESVDLVKLRKLLSYTKKKDTSSFKNLAFYYEGFADRQEQYQTEIRVHYLPSKRMSEHTLGRIYAYTTSYFSPLVKYGGLQNMKKEYRAYLCEHSHWDVDLENAHPSILYSLLQKLNKLGDSRETIDIPPLLMDYVYGRDALLKKIVALFRLSSATQAKKLLLRLMYGGTMDAWRTEYKVAPLDPNIIGEFRLLLEKLENFPSHLEKVSLSLYNMAEFSILKQAITTTNPKDKEEKEMEPNLKSFLSLLLSDLEKQILLFSERYLAESQKRSLEVLIHDGGLLRRLPNESQFPKELLVNLNTAAQEHFGFSKIKFVNKPFDLSLRDDIHKEPQFQLEFDYSKWKFHFEEHRDLCYISQEKFFFMADNKQTNIYKNPGELKIAAPGCWVYSDITLPSCSIQLGTETAIEEGGGGTELEENVSHSKSKKKATLRRSPFIDVWLADYTRKKYDAIYFSEKTALRDHTVTYVTPKKHRKKFKPKNRYIFEGWDLMEEEEDPQGSPKPFLAFLSYLLPNSELFEYTLNWIAHLFQYPDDRITGTCLCLLSRIQGSGKSTLMEVLLSMLGRYGMKINNPKEQLFNNFTHAMEHHILLAIDDTDSKVLYEEYEAFKNLITSDDARIRELFSPERTIISNVRFFLISNNTSILKLEENSRRFAVMEPSDSLAQDHDFFITFRQYWASVGNRRATLQYLLEHSIPKVWHPERSYPMTNLKRQIEGAHLAPLPHYMYSLAKTLQEEQQQQHSEEKPAEYVDVQATELRNKFELWLRTCTTHNNNSSSSNNKKKRDALIIPNRNEFPIELNNIGVVNTRNLPPGSDKGGHKSGQWYRIPLSTFAQKADDYYLESISPEFCAKGELISTQSNITKIKRSLQWTLSDNLPLAEQQSKEGKGTMTNKSKEENIIFKRSQRKKKKEKLIRFQSSQDASGESLGWGSGNNSNMVSEGNGILQPGDEMQSYFPEQKKRDCNGELPQKLIFHRNDYTRVKEFFNHEDCQKQIIELVSAEVQRRHQQNLLPNPQPITVNQNTSFNISYNLSSHPSPDPTTATPLEKESNQQHSLKQNQNPSKKQELLKAEDFPKSL